MTSNFRRLNSSETAFTYCNEQSPLSVVIVIEYKGEVSLERISEALKRLQKRHSLLQCRIEKNLKGYVFKKMAPGVSVPLQVVHSAGKESWKTHTEKALNTPFDTRGPLLHCYFIPPKDPSASGEVLLNLHHSIIDGIAARLILTEFLRLLGGQQLEDLPPATKPSDYPKAFQKLAGASRRLRFMMAQMKDEMQFFRRGLKSSIPAKDDNAIQSFQLDKALSTKILRRAGQLNVSPNSLISAAMLHALFKHQNDQGPTLMRAVGFADLRRMMEPRVDPQELGCYAAIARFTLPISPDQELIHTARELWNQMYQAGKKGDLYFFSQLSTQIMKISFRLKRFRLANTALSYIGPLDLQKKYGPVEVMDIRTYITNNRLGPSLTAFGKYLFGKIGIDLNYLPSEFEEAEVMEMIAEIKASLRDIV